MPESPSSRCPLQQTSDKIHRILDRTFQRPMPDGGIPRTFHHKTQGALRGTFKVEPPSEALARKGLFAEAAEYPALVRFSNAMHEDDNKPEGRGMAIKLGNVTGDFYEDAARGVQDFLLVNDEQGMAPDAEHSLLVFEQLDGIEKFSDLDLLVPRYSMPGFNPFRIRWGFVKSIWSTIRNHLRYKNLAGMSYYSQTPYQLGDVAAKYQVHPTNETRQRAAKAKGKDYQTRLQNLLDGGTIAFDFCVQPRAVEADPIDDICVIWQSPKIRVARLELPSQDVAASLALGDQIAYSPWNCLKDHTPLGSINAVRRQAYTASVSKRGGEPQFPSS